jgi:hypothetical protein
MHKNGEFNDFSLEGKEEYGSLAAELTPFCDKKIYSNQCKQCKKPIGEMKDAEWVFYFIK